MILGFVVAVQNPDDLVQMPIKFDSIWHFAVALLVPFLVLFYMVNMRTPKVATRGSVGRVVGVVGRMGSGKSYLAVRMVYKTLMAGGEVASNFTLDFAPGELPESASWYYFSGWEAFGVLRGTFACRSCDWVGRRIGHRCPDCGGKLWCVRPLLVVVDEVHLLAPSTAAMRLPMEARQAISNARKYGLEFWWISQHERRVNPAVRELTSVMYVCNSTRGGKNFRVTEFEPENARKVGMHLAKMRFRMDTSIADRYDTLESVEIDDHLSSRPSKK
jgi:hypothetical protein